MMALWFEPELQFDIPDSNVLLPAASFGLNITDTDRFDEVSSLHSMMYGSLFFLMQFVKPLRVLRPEKKTSISSTHFENTSLPPGIPHYIFENVVELINDNEPHEDILEM